MAIELIEVSPGQWAYRVGGVYQEFDPDEAGYVPMTEARARACAEAVRDRLVAG
jgi:hypothetical protein